MSTLAAPISSMVTSPRDSQHTGPSAIGQAPSGTRTWPPSPSSPGQRPRGRLVIAIAGGHNGQVTPRPPARPPSARTRAASRRRSPAGLRVQRLDDEELARDRVAQAILAGLLHLPLDVALDLDAVDVEAGREGELQTWLDGYCELLRLPGGPPARTLHARPRAQPPSRAGAAVHPVDETAVQRALERPGRSPYVWRLGLLTAHARTARAAALLDAALRHALRELPEPEPRRRRLEHALCRLWLARGDDDATCVYLGWRGPHRGAWQVGVWDAAGRLLLTVCAARPRPRVRGLLDGERQVPRLAGRSRASST
jgi:hypothetical protein